MHFLLCSFMTIKQICGFGTTVILFLCSSLLLFNVEEGILQPCFMDVVSPSVSLWFSLRKLCRVFQEICASLCTEFVRTLFPAFRL